MSPDASHLHELVVRELRAAQAEHDTLRALLADADTLPDLADQADRLQTHNLHLTRYRAVLQRCRDLEKALEALERGDYGTCELCGEDIEPRRLLAVPSTRLCISCQELVEDQASHTALHHQHRLR